MSSLAWLLILLVALLAAGFLFQSYTADRDKKPLPPVGGFRAPLRFTSQEFPGPALILNPASRNIPSMKRTRCAPIGPTDRSTCR